MKYALGNMLNGAGGLNADQLSLDLQFATDKTLTARKGPTPVLTRASTATFVGSNGLIQSAAINAARFDHDPVTLACKGLLIEESRTNQCYNSNLLTTASWGLTNTTVATSAAGPDGTTAYEIAETTANSNHALSNTGGTTSTPVTTLTTGVTYAQSIFLKKVAGSVDWAQLTFTGLAFPTTQYANFNLFTGVIGNSSGVTARIEQFPNGWYRCSITATATSSTTGGSAVIIQFTNNTDTTTRGPSYPGSTANKILAAMGQLEAGSFPTSYIPTTTASLARSADVCSISGSAFSGFWNNSEGSLFASGISRGNLVMASSGTNANQIAIFRNSSPLYMRFDVASGGTYTAQIIGATIADGSFNKTAGSYASNDARAAFNGTLGTPDVTVLVPLTLTTLNIGTGSTGGNPHNGTISAIRYYRKRLDNAKLQTLTT